MQNRRKRNLFLLPVLAAACAALLSTSCSTDSKLLYSFKPVRKSIWSAAGMAETPVIAGDTIYYLSGYPWNDQVFLHAVDKKTGKQLWESKDQLKQFHLDGDKIFGTGRPDLFRSEPARTTKCFLRAYSTKDGSTIWDIPSITDRRGVEIIGADKYVCVLANRELQGVDKDKGTVIWEADQALLPSVVPNVVMEDKFVFAELEDRSIAKISTTTGVMEGNLKLGPIDPKLPRVLILKGDEIVIGGGDGHSAIVNIKTDKRQNLDTGWLTSKLTLSDDIAFFGAQTNPLTPKPSKRSIVMPPENSEKEELLMCAFDSKTKEYVWKTPVETPIRSGPLIANGVVYAGAVRNEKAYLYAFDVKTGKILWQSECIAPLSDVAYGNDMIFVNGGGVLNALDTATGKSLWTYQIKDVKIVGNPVFEDGVVYVVADDSNLYALKAEKPVAKER